jgi:alkaline phosphatase
MGISTITAGRIYAGQLKGQTGEEHQLSFDKFPNIALAKARVFNLDFIQFY